MHLLTSCIFLVQEASHQLLPLLVKRMELFLAQEIEGLKECKAIRYTNSFFFWDLDVSYWSGFIHIDQHQQDVWDTRVYKFQDLNCHINSSLLLNSFQEMCLVWGPALNIWYLHSGWIHFCSGSWDPTLKSIYISIGSCFLTKLFCCLCFVFCIADSLHSAAAS